eukprot:scpid43731/ scgid24867/ 
MTTAIHPHLNGCVSEEIKRLMIPVWLHQKNRLGWIQMVPVRLRESHHARTARNRPAPEESSANHVWMMSAIETPSINGSTPSPYMAIDKGSPCVIPSDECTISPSTYRRAGLRYVLMTAVEREGHE